MNLALTVVVIDLFLFCNACTICTALLSACLCQHLYPCPPLTQIFISLLIHHMPSTSFLQVYGLSLSWKLSLCNDEWEAIHGENINGWFVFSETVFKAKSFKLFLMITCIEVHIFLGQFCWFWFGVKVTLVIKRMSEIAKIKAESFVSHYLSDWVQTLHL